MILLKLAWRELWMHKKRSFITLLLSAFATALFIFANALNDGSHDQLIRSSVEVYPGYLQVTNRQFEDEPGFEHLISDVKSIKERLLEVDGVASAAIRFEAYALYATDEQTIGGMFTGIEPEEEAKVSRLKTALVEGAYLEESDTSAVYMGVALAKRLGIEVGDSVSFIGTGADYSFAADNLIVKGLYRTKLYSFDNGTAFVNKTYFDSVMQSENLGTHIIVGVDSLDHIDAITQAVNGVLPPPLIAKSYKETMEDLLMAMEIDETFGYITLGIFFIVIFFVIAIFAFLSVYARIRQIGVLRAVGTTPGQVIAMLLIETMLLGVLSVGIGGVGGAIASYHYEQHPISFESMMDVDMEEYSKQYNMVAEVTVPTRFDIEKILFEMVVMLVMNLLTVLYPIVMINRFTPVEAIRYV